MKAGKTNLNSTNQKDLRNFGLLIGFVLAALLGVAWPLYKGNVINQILVGIGSIFAVSGVIFPKVLTYPYKFWMLIGHALGWINSRIILGLIFSVLFIPVGIVRRLLQKDVLSKKWDNKASSYWVNSEEKENNHMERPF